MLLIFIEIFGELLVELLIEWGVRKARHPGAIRVRRTLPVLSGYAGLAAVIGALSVIFLPHHFIKLYELRVANLLIAPLLAGFVMSWRRRQLNRRGEDPMALDNFLAGFVFALVIAVIRFHFAG